MSHEHRLLTDITEGIIGSTGIGGALLGARDVAKDPSMATVGATVVGSIPGVRAGKALDNVVDSAKATKNLDTVDTKDLPTVVFTHEKTPGIAKNIQSAQAEGAPEVLNRTANKSEIRQNRREALGNSEKPPAGQSLDEYPFASTTQGGKGSRVESVPVSEQNSQGGTLSSFYQNNGIKDGDSFKVEVRDK